jgi:alpha-N-arabinofuranosidase
MRYTPVKDGDRAGLVAFQGENFHYFLAVTRAQGRPVVQLIERAGKATNDADSVIASAPLAAAPDATIYLRIAARRDRYDFFYATAPGRWTPLKTDADGTILSTKTAGGFVGVVFGLHAYSAP